jgi:5-methylcytosine-specific restriction endonuclease McrA
MIRSFRGNWEHFEVRPARLAKIQRLATRDGGRRCYWCKKKLTNKQVTFDHVIPKSLMGEHNRGEDNEVISCSPCNSERGAMPCLH